MQIMQVTAEEKLATLEEKVSTLSVLGEQIRRLEADLAALHRKIAKAQGWKAMVGGVEDTKIAREADALGRKFRNSETLPLPGAGPGHRSFDGTRLRQ